MKIRILFVSAGIAALFATPVLAQKGELSTAKSSFETYDMLRAANNGPMVKTSLSKAKIAIDKASQNEKTSTLPETYALKAAIYAHSAMADTIESTSAPIIGAAEDALAKAKELDTKKENEKYFASAELALAQAKANVGISQWKANKFADAYKSFTEGLKYSTGDTILTYYAGSSAMDGKNYKGAIEHYKKLTSTNFSKNSSVYNNLALAYFLDKDTANAASIAAEGVNKFPSDLELLKRDIDITLESGKTQQAQEKILKAIARDPKNQKLYFAAGITYSQAADANGVKLSKASKGADAAMANSLRTERAQNYERAAEMFKKALEIDPNYFDAVLQMGYVTLNPAIDTYNAAQQLPAAKQKEFDAALAKSKVQFDAARPYLEKATEIQPGNVDAWKNLKTYYIGVQNTAKANEVQKKIDELSK